MLYRFSVQYWSYEQALELPFGLRCCRSKEGLSEPLLTFDDGSYSPDGPVEGKERR